MDGWTDDGWRDRGHSLRPHSSRLRAAFVLLLLIGATWLLGLLAVNRDALTFHYLFAVFSCLQVGREVLGHLCHFLSEMPSPEWPWEVPGGVGGVFHPVSICVLALGANRAAPWPWCPCSYRIGVQQGLPHTSRENGACCPSAAPPRAS